MLNVLQRFDAMGQLARSGLQGDCPEALEIELRWALVAAALAANDTTAAEAEAVRLGGVQGVPAEILADAWARIAATLDFLGQPERADQAFERSLDLGPGGLRALREVSARTPERQAACEALMSRARQRHPDHPDLALQRVASALLAQDAAEAEQALEQMPAPLPERLERDVELVRARVDLLAGRTGPALDVVRARLDDNPADVEALVTLIECWRLRQVPSAQEMRLRLSWASGRISHPGVAAQVQILLRELPAEPDPAAAPQTEPAPR
jgi:tetratricopeptide (TPR) repeat protein